MLDSFCFCDDCGFSHQFNFAKVPGGVAVLLSVSLINFPGTTSRCITAGQVFHRNFSSIAPSEPVVLSVYKNFLLQRRVSMHNWIEIWRRAGLRNSGLKVNFIKVIAAFTHCLGDANLHIKHRKALLQ